MNDNLDKATRSRIMSSIHSSNTKPELLTRKVLHRLGYRFRLNSKVGKIKPDIVLRSRKIAIFVHGCFWHQHDGCKHVGYDRTYSDDWKKKLDGNRERDQRVIKELKEQGWRVAIVWECASLDKKVFEMAIKKLHTWIKSGKSQYFETDYKKT